MEENHYILYFVHSLHYYKHKQVNIFTVILLYILTYGRHCNYSQTNIHVSKCQVS